MDRHDYNPTAVQHARIAAGYRTQADAARRFDVDVRTVGRVENGIACSFELLKAMAQAYGVPLFSLLYDTAEDEAKNFALK